MKSKTLRVISVLCMLVVLVCTLPVPTAAASRSLGDITKEINEKKAHLEDLEANIKANQNNKAKAQQALAEYEAQYNELVALIDEQEVMITNTEADLDRKSQELSDTIVSIQENRDLYEKRLRAIYDMNTSNAMFASLFAVSSFSEMLQVTDALKRISVRDTDLLAQLAEQQATFERQKADLETAIENLTAELVQLEENRDWANGKVEEMKNAIYVANVNIQASESEKEYTQEEIDELVAEYNRIFAENQKKGSQVGDGTRYNGDLLWPVPASGRISSYFGDPRSNTGYHYGIDIPAAAYTNIVAAAPGTVITATWHYSYGNYIVIDHGGGMRTLYAHCIELYVSTGTWVEGNMVIAGVGNTGNSFGNHLHFEVHDGGARQNPLNYLNFG